MDNCLDNCIFCKIVKKEIPASIIEENNFAMAFMDINPISNGHVVVIPKKHFQDLLLCDDLYLREVTSLLKKVTDRIDRSKLKPWGYNFVSNQGSIAGQVVNHFHMHIIPKYAAKEGLEFSYNYKNIDDIDEVFKKITKTNFKID